MAIIYLNPDKERRARRAVKEKGGDPNDEAKVLEEYIRLAGAYRGELEKPKKVKKRGRKKAKK